MFKKSNDDNPSAKKKEVYYFKLAAVLIGPRLLDEDKPLLCFSCYFASIIDLIDFIDYQQCVEEALRR